MITRTCGSYFEIQCVHRVRIPEHELRDPLWENLVLVGTPCGGVVRNYVIVKLLLEEWYREPSKSQTGKIRGNS